MATARSTSGHSSRSVLVREPATVGAGNGRLTFGLVSVVGAVDAVEPSPAMVDQARQGQDDPRITWVVSSFEEAELVGPYGLVAAAEALHWLDWPWPCPRSSPCWHRGPSWPRST